MSESGPRLHVLVERAGQVVYRGTHDRFPVVIGRSTEANVQLPYQFISRQHASITVEGAVARVRDMGSRYKLENDRGTCEELRIDGRGQFRIGDLEINLRVEKQLSEDPERTQAAAAPTKTFQRPSPVLPAEIASDRRDGDRRDSDRRSGPRRPALEKSATEVVSPRSIPAAPPPSGDLEVVKTVAEDAMENNAKPRPHKPLFEGALGKFQWILDPEIVNIQSAADVAVQGAVSWGPHLFDIRNFIVGDKINLSPRLTDEIALPALARAVKLGKFEARGAVFNLPRDLSWSLQRTGSVVDEKTLRDEGRLKDVKNHLSLMLQKEEILTLNFTPELKSHFRYIKKPMPFFPRTWIENKEHFKKAIQASIFVHLVFSAIALLSVPEVKAPDVENVPKRFAKLLVEPPTPVLAEPPPPPPEPPPPEPPPPPPPEPIVPEKPPEPPKEKPKPLKPKEKPKPLKADDKPIEKVVPVAEKPVSKPIPVVKSQPVPVVKSPNPPTEAKKDLPDSPAPPVKGAVTPAPQLPAPSPAQVEAEALQKMFNSMPSVGATAAKLPDNVKLVKTGGQAAPGIKVGGIVNQVPTAGGAVVSGIGTKPSALAEAGQAGYAATTGGKAGSRKIGGVVADAPKFTGAMQGLSMAELMAIVNKYLGEIQRCYERSLIENSGLVGRVEYEWEISPSGGVKTASVKRSEMAGAEQLNGCVMGVIRGMKFPASKNGLETIASVGFPFGRQ